MKINNIVIHIPDFMQAQMSLLGLPDNVQFSLQEPVSQLQDRQKDEEVGPVRSNKKRKQEIFKVLNTDWFLIGQ